MPRVVAQSKHDVDNVLGKYSTRATRLSISVSVYIEIELYLKQKHDGIKTITYLLCMNSLGKPLYGELPDSPASSQVPS